jgi:hypothetical protein
MNEKSITGKIEFIKKVWDSDPEDGWYLDGWNIINMLNIEKYENRVVKITIEEIPQCSNTITNIK